MFPLANTLNPLGSVAAVPSGGGGVTLTELFTSGAAGGSRADYHLPVGVTFAVGSSPITVYKLGRWKVTGNSSSHDVKLVDALGNDISGGTVTVDIPAGTNEAYVYADLATPIVLSANTTYILVADTIGSDRWHDYASYTSTGDISAFDGCYNAGGTSYVGTPNAAHSMYGPVNLQYTL